MYIQAWSAKDLRASVKAKVENSVGTASTDGLSNGLWTFQISRELNWGLREFIIQGEP
jgi:hypothetical protein